MKPGKNLQQIINLHCISVQVERSLAEFLHYDIRDYVYLNSSRHWPILQIRESIAKENINESR